MRGVIVKAISGFYYVLCGEELLECKARGVFKKRGITPLVGDVAEVLQTPAYQTLDMWHERPTQGREGILDTRRNLGVLLARDQMVADQ